MKIKEMPLEEKYDRTLDDYLLASAMGYVLAKELGVVDKYIDLQVKAQKKMLPSYLGIAYKVLKAIAPGKAFKQVIDQYVYIAQGQIPMSNIELTRVSNREAAIRIKNCPVLRKSRDLVKKAGLDLDPRFICEMGPKIISEVSKEFRVDTTVELEEDGCITTAKLK